MSVCAADSVEWEMGNVTEVDRGAPFHQNHVLEEEEEGHVEEDSDSACPDILSLFHVHGQLAEVVVACDLYLFHPPLALFSSYPPLVASVYLSPFSLVACHIRRAANPSHHLVLSKRAGLAQSGPTQPIRA